MRNDIDPYEVLGVSRSATQAEIVHAYRARLRTDHPDTRSTPASHGADDRLAQVLAAYQLLRDPARRAQYDATPSGSVAPGPVEIRVTHRRSDTPTAGTPTAPLRVGPVRRHW